MPKVEMSIDLDSIWQRYHMDATTPDDVMRLLLAYDGALEELKRVAMPQCENCARLAEYQIQAYRFCLPCARKFLGYTPADESKIPAVSLPNNLAALQAQLEETQRELEEARQLYSQARIRVWNRAYNACGDEKTADRIAAAFDAPLAEPGSPLARAARKATP